MQRPYPDPAVLPSNETETRRRRSYHIWNTEEKDVGKDEEQGEETAGFVAQLGFKLLFLLIAVAALFSANLACSCTYG